MTDSIESTGNSWTEIILDEVMDRILSEEEDRDGDDFWLPVQISDEEVLPLIDIALLKELFNEKLTKAESEWRVQTVMMNYEQDDTYVNILFTGATLHEAFGLVH